MYVIACVYGVFREAWTSVFDAYTAAWIQNWDLQKMIRDFDGSATGS
jgi:hypothetical protein